MPKVYIGAQARAEATEHKQNEAFTWAVKTAKARIGKTYVEAANTVGISRNTVTRLTREEAVSNAKFGVIRSLAHEVKMTKEEWLRLGGF